MAFGALSPSTARPMMMKMAPPSRRHGHHDSRRNVWTAFVVLVVVFYAGLLYLFTHHHPSADVEASTPGLRQLGGRAPPGQEQEQEKKEERKAAAGGIDAPEGPPSQSAVRFPPGSIDGVAVLGMHRSGTSMITGLLERMGLHLGPPGSLLGAVPGENDKGFFERMEVINQNDELMKAQGVNWSLRVFDYDHLEALRLALADSQVFAQGRAALAYYNDPAHTPWAVKDPRLCFTLRFWMAFWKTPPAVLFVYRHPIEVAKSLVRRKEFGLTRGLHLWMAYNRLAIENSRGLCRVITSDVALIQDGPGEVRRIHDALVACGVAIPREPTLEDVRSFIDPSLRHHKQTHEGECDADDPVLWRSEDEGHEKERQETAYGHARRLYCAMQDGSAFLPGFGFEDLSDAPPP